MVFLAHVSRRGWAESLLVLFSGAFYWSMRENLQIKQMLLPHDYEVTHAALLKIGHAPFFVILGWTFTGFLAWHVAERIAQRGSNWQVRSNPFIVLILSVFVVESVSYLTEVAGTIAGWWEWGSLGTPWYQDERLSAEWSTPLLVRIPSQPIGGWRMYELFFLGPLILLTGFLRADRRLTFKRALIAGAACIVAYVIQFGLLAGPQILTDGELVITSGAWYVVFGFAILILSFIRWHTDPPHEAAEAKSGAFWKWNDRWSDRIAAIIYLGVCIAVIADRGNGEDFLGAVSFGLLALLAFTPAPAWVMLALAAVVAAGGIAVQKWSMLWAPFFFAESLIALAIWRTWQRRFPRLGIVRKPAAAGSE